MSVTVFPKYESYKDSGIDWIGEIPASWKQVANKHLFKLRKVQVGKRSTDYDLLSLTLGGIIKRDMENPEGKFPAEFDTYQEVRPYDFVFCHFDVEETPRTVGLSRFQGMITGAYTVYELAADANTSFLYYFYLNADTDKKLRGLYKGLRNTISKDSFGAFKTPLPPLSEQHAIAVFLDEKCSKIDEAVRIKKGQIKLLHERRQILIQQAVTRGVDPDAPMKDSGIKWIGQIPAHWELRRARHLTTKIGSGITPTGGSLTYIDNGIPLLRSQNILFGSIDMEAAVKIAPNVHANMKNSSVQRGDVLLNITGGSIGRCHYVTTDEPLNVNQHVCIVRPNCNISTVFLNMLFSSQLGQKQIWLHQQGGGREGLNFAAIKEFLFPIPPLEEQQKIEETASEQSTKLDDALKIKEDQIAKLKEYKKTLINAAVTGKIKVI